MKRSPLDLKHRGIISERLENIGIHLSEFSFPNLYFFRKKHQYELLQSGDSLFISGLSYDKNRYLMPLPLAGEIDDAYLKELKKILKTTDCQCLFPIPEEWLKFFNDGDFFWTHNEDDSDYMLLTEKFQTYAGKKMHKKKNLLNQFLRKYEVLLTPLRDEILDEARHILEIWQKNAVKEHPINDYIPCLEALRLHRELNLVGALAFANGEPAGFVLGEALNSETFAIHFAKADIRFTGIYQFLFSRFACDFSSNYHYTNIEQDMGLEGLRKTKKSYRPDFMQHKYRICLKNKANTE